MEKSESLGAEYKPSPIVVTATPLRTEAQIIERSVLLVKPMSCSGVNLCFTCVPNKVSHEGFW